MKKGRDKLLNYSLFFFFVCAPLESISLGESFSLAKLTSIVVIAMWAFNGFPWPKTKMLNAFYILLGYAFLSAIWGIDSANSFTRIITFLIPSVLIAVAMSASIKTKEDVSLYMTGYVIGCIVAAFSGLYYRDAMLNAAIMDSQERLTAFGADQNALAFLMSMGVVCLLSYYSATTAKWGKILSILLMGVFSLVVLSTGSRTGLVLLLAAVSGFLFFQKNKRASFLIIVLIILFIPVIVSFLPESIIDRFAETEQLVSSGDFSDRGSIWERGLEAFWDDNFVLGVGYSNFSNMLMKHFNFRLASHNTYLTYLVEFGVIGVPVFIYVLLVIWQYARKIDGLTRNRFVYFYILPLFAVMFTLETEYKRWIFILGILLESWYNLEKQSNTISH